MSKKSFDNIYQFKITLKNIRPPIWRRIQVPETYTFWDLHVAIQDAMGWDDYHLHSFDMKDPKTGRRVEISTPEEGAPPMPFPGRPKILKERNQKIAGWFTTENKTALYTYDFGDDWEHTVLLEKVLPREEGIRYPRCITGKRACPREDSGGPWGYQRVLEVLQNPEHAEYEDMLGWLGGEIDPEDFSCDEVEFDSPARRWREFKDMMP